MNDQDAAFEALNQAWDALYDSLPGRWHIGKPFYAQARAAWLVTAWGPQPGRNKAQQAVIGTGDTAVAALRDLDDRLRGVPRSKGGRMDELRRRLRFRYVGGASNGRASTSGDDARATSSGG